MMLFHKTWKKSLRAVLILSILTVFTVFSLPSNAVFAETSDDDKKDLTPNSKAAILYEATTDTVLYEKNADMELPPASMTKVMTAILVLEKNPELEGELTVSKDAVRRYYCSNMVAQMHLKAGEIISYEDCMKFLLIFSANEAATAIAFDMCDEYKDFINMMNDKAEELGCENTHFVDCTGLSSSNHYTTPRDMAKILQYAMTFDKFRECTQQSKGVVPASNVRNEGFEYGTANYVAFPDDCFENPYSQYMTGGKTGNTPAAGWCFAGCMEKDGLEFYSVAMGAELVDYGDGEHVVQGDFLDTLSMYGLTDGLTAENIGEKYPKSSKSPYIIVGVLGFILLLLIGVFSTKLLRKK